MSRRYFGIGWRRCVVCGLEGYAYKIDRHFEVKHVTPHDQASQLTFADSSMALIRKRRQKTCYIPKRFRQPYVKEHTRFNKHKAPVTIKSIRDPARIAVFERVPT